jgi:hypothetical protein
MKNGKLTFQGFVYEGEYISNGIPQGKGKASFDDGASYEGDFVNGTFHGKGKMIYPNGRVEEGNFDGGRFLG